MVVHMLSVRGEINLIYLDALYALSDVLHLDAESILWDCMSSMGTVQCNLHRAELYV